MYKVKGNVIDVQTQEGTSEKGAWKRVTVVVETADKFNNTIPVQFFNPDTTPNKGDEVEIECYIGGREYKSKYYPTIDGKEVSIISSSAAKKDAREEVFESESDDSELPF